MRQLQRKVTDIKTITDSRIMKNGFVIRLFYMKQTFILSNRTPFSVYFLNFARNKDIGLSQLFEYKFNI